MEAPEFQDLHRRAAEQLFSHILPFWCGPAVDREQGGWMAWLSNDLKPDRRKPKGLIVNTRILWAFSAVYRVRPEPLYREMAHRAFDFVMNRFWDPRCGGGFWQLDDAGSVTDDSKKIYGQAFCIYALVEYHRAFGTPDSLARAQELFGLIDRHAHDPRHGGYLEVCRPDWSEAVGARLSEKDLNEKKSMNCHLHLLEAFASLYRVWKDQQVGERLSELIELFEQRILDASTHHLHHFFDDAWKLRSDSYTFGHDIEASWLLCEAADALGDASLFKRAEAMALALAGAVLAEGLDAEGGLCYEGKAGQIIDARQECWPQAEAVVGFLNAFELARDAKFLAAARRVWDYLEQHIVDRQHGEWFWRINADGLPDATLPKVSEWKGPYHGSRMCLETMSRLNRLARSP
jgi:mannobiose 2-epimerase